ncbi:MAG: T9SS type A sorting domain-containing protein [Flavobacteriales bacterium]|nr:T9SS type A sorting domain-containing protein [Flavobacteriales bacterium]
MRRLQLFLAGIVLALFASAQDFPVVSKNFGKFGGTSFNSYSFVNTTSHNGGVYLSFSTGSSGEVHYFSGTNWTAVTTTSGILSTIVYGQVSVGSKMYFATSNGLSIKNGTNWSSELSGTKVLAVDANSNYEVVLTTSGLSYRNVSSSTWSNLSISALKYAGSVLQPIAGNAVIIKNDSAWVSYSSRGVRKIELKTGTVSKVVNQDDYSFSEPVINFATHDGAVFSAGPSYITRYSDTMLKSLYRIQNNFQYGAIKNLPVFTDKYGKLWFLKSYRGGVTAITFNGERPNSPRVFIPIKLDDTNHPAFYYNPQTDSVYSISDNLAFAMADVRNPKYLYGKNIETLDINEVSAPILNGGINGYDHELGVEHYLAPKSSEKSPLFSSGLWIGGLDDSNNVHLSAMTYAQKGFDYFPGPLNASTGAFNPNDSVKFDRLWKVNKSDIQKHINLYGWKGAVKESETTEAIWNWPGNREKGKSSDALAPFIDNNGNGIYEPNKGDYPDIKGDQAIYWIMNDLAKPHTETGGTSFGMEIHGMAYAYACPTVSSSQAEYGINYTTFYKYKIINRSDSNYHDVVVGLHTDSDLGNYSDDYVGCHVTQNMGYCYNGDTNDEGILGYGVNAPMFSTLILDAPSFIHDSIDGDGDGQVDEDDEKRYMGGFVYYNNDFSAIGNPRNPSEYYNYLNNKWKNGDNISRDFAYGSSGKGGQTSYMFPDTTDKDNGTKSWTEKKAGNMPADRRFLINSFPFDVAAKDTVEFEYAFVFSHNPSQENQLPKNLEYVKAIKQWYYQGADPACYQKLGVERVENGGAIEANVYPNPFENTITVKTESQIESVIIHDLCGKVLLDQKDVRTSLLEVNTSNIPAGMFLITIITEDGKATKKLLKM